MMFVHPGGITGTICSSFLGYKDHHNRHNFTASSQGFIRLYLCAPKTTRCNPKYNVYNQINYTKTFEILSASVMHRASYLQQQPLRYSYLILQLKPFNMHKVGSWMKVKVVLPRFGSVRVRDIFGQPEPEPGQIFLKFPDPQTEPLLTLSSGQKWFGLRFNLGLTH